MAIKDKYCKKCEELAQVKEEMFYLKNAMQSLAIVNQVDILIKLHLREEKERLEKYFENVSPDMIKKEYLEYLEMASRGEIKEME